MLLNPLPEHTKQRGVIINWASSVAPTTLNGENTAYIAAASAIASMTKSMSVYATEGIRVNAVAPGYIVTGMTKDYEQGVKEHLNGRIQMGRPGQPEEVAKLALFLCAEASYITGSIMPIDGGLLTP